MQRRLLRLVPAGLLFAVDALARRRLAQRTRHHRRGWCRRSATVLATAALGVAAHRERHVLAALFLYIIIDHLDQRCAAGLCACGMRTQNEIGGNVRVAAAGTPSPG